MRSVSLISFWLGTVWLAYVYLGYPVLLWLLGLQRRFHPALRDGFFPRVSVMISAHNEEKDIGWKVAETLNWDYPVDRLELLVASDASEDRTDEIVRSVHDSRLKFVRMEKRVGKNVALNHLTNLATGDVLFFTDANSHIEPTCLHKMVRYFSDARVGCVTGKYLTLKERAESAIILGESKYWAYESLIQSFESRLGSALGCFGAIFCVRRSLFTPLDGDLPNDLELPMRIGGTGYAVLFEPTACSIEKATHSPQEEFNRRRRICGQGILGFWRLRKTLRGLRAWQFVSRKFLRWLSLIPLALLLVSTTALATHLVFQFLLAVQLVFYALALLGWLTAIGGRQGRPLVAIPFYFVLVNLAAVVGIIEIFRGRRFHVWEVALLTRGTETSSED
jgi:cellulose synthase/poly-beta-1,6-N-acetylglucosamine synthase-like glycosyltransferase